MHWKFRHASSALPVDVERTAGISRHHWIALIAAWLVAALLILLHTAAVREYTNLLAAADPNETGGPATPFRQIVPVGHADAQMWVRLAAAADEKRALRLRFTDSDNAPVGREVHWSSAFMGLLRAAGFVQRTLTGEPPAHALEQTLLWFNAVLLFVVMIVASTLVARRGGIGAGVLVTLALLGQKRIYEAFAPTDVDHHGVIALASFGLLLGVAGMGAGWISPDRDVAGATANKHRRARVVPTLDWLPRSRATARRAALFSAGCGAAGMWFSAATTLPVIALAGIGGLLATWWSRAEAKRAGAMFDPSLWQIWGRAGAAGSAVCYILEYAPSHLGMRLEVNHPFWSLAWWGGAELIAVCSKTAWDSPTVPWNRLVVWRQLVFPILALAVAPGAILLGGTATFMVSDPFVSELRHFVVEGLSLPAMARRYGLSGWIPDFLSALLLIPAAMVAIRRRGVETIAVRALLLVATAFIVMSCAEMRWWLNAAIAELALLLVLLPLLARKTRVGLVVATSAVLLGVAIHRVVRDHRANEQHATTAMDLLQPLYRNIAATLRASQPDGEIILLADPNASAAVSYFGHFKSIGTLYWENAAGLRAAAAIICARTDAEAARLIRLRGITHIAVISTSNFIGEYNQLLYSTTERAEIEKSFAVRLTREPPPWLQPIPYRIPSELKSASPFVLLFKVDFGQSDVTRLYQTAIAQAAAGNPDAAEKSLAAAAAATPIGTRFEILQSAATAFYDYGADAAAARAFRQALQLRDDPMTTTTLAWILATSSDPAVRDGRVALALIEASARGSVDPTLLSAFAAACAETGRFPDAVAAAERALAAARSTGDRASEPLLIRRLETYRAGHPWRQ